MHEQKYRYFIDGKEVDNRTDYLNATMSGDYVSYFDGDSVFSVSFNSFFGENKDNNKMIKREVNGHIIDILDLGQIKEDNFSKLLKDPNSANKIYQELKDFSNKINDQNNKIISDELLKEPKTEFEGLFSKINKCSSQCFCDGSCKKPQENNLHNSTRHKSQNGETHKEKGKLSEYKKTHYILKTKNLLGETNTSMFKFKEQLVDYIERKEIYLESYEIMFQDNPVSLTDLKAEISAKKENKVEDPEQIVTTTITVQTTPEQAEKIKEIVKEFNNQISAEKTEKEENLVFPKDSEIHKEENKNCNWTMCGQIECKHCYPNKEFKETKEVFNKSKEELPSHEPLDFSVILADWTDRMSGTKDRPATFTVEGIKESSGKINYEELDWDYIDSMALRMSKNLEKYPSKNWQKKMDIKKLAEASIRHARKIIQEIENDEESLQEHATALGCNGMMINYQLKIQERQKTLENFVK